MFAEPEPISWTLVAYAKSTFTARYSKRHLMVPDADQTLCGIRPPWGATSFGQNYENDCSRCFGGHDG